MGSCRSRSCSRPAKRNDLHRRRFHRHRHRLRRARRHRAALGQQRGHKVKIEAIVAERLKTLPRLTRFRSRARTTTASTSAPTIATKTPTRASLETFAWPRPNAAMERLDAHVRAATPHRRFRTRSARNKPSKNRHHDAAVSGSFALERKRADDPTFVRKGYSLTVAARGGAQLHLG